MLARELRKTHRLLHAANGVPHYADALGKQVNVWSAICQ